MDLNLSSNVNAKIAAALVAARRTGGTADDSIWSDTKLSNDDINRIQQLVSAEMGWDQSPAVPGYWKGGGPTPDAEPSFVHLPKLWVRPSPGPFRAEDFRRRGIEIEVAFRLARDIQAHDLVGRAAHDPASFLDAMAVSIELADFRWAGAEKAPEGLRRADMQSNGALVVGAWTPLRAVDWAQQTAHLEVDGKPVGSYTGSHPVGDPLRFAPQWLTHAVARHGQLAEGSVLTTGTWCGVVWLDGAADVVARFDGIGEARLALV